MLNVNYSGIQDYKNVCYCKDDKGKFQYVPELEVINMLTMAFGMTSITEKNLPEWEFRLAFYQKLFEPVMRKWDDSGKTLVDIIMTVDMVKKFIGLSSNVYQETRAAFVKRMVKSFADSLARKSHD
jgi:hypothetical protein